MNILHLRTLVTIADHTSFAVAAERLFLTPAAVSHQMSGIENELQVALFDRNTRPPRLNAHGTLIAEQAREVLRGFDALVETARAPGELSGTLVLGCIAGVSSDLIPRALASLRKRHPRVHVRMEEGLAEPLANRVRRRELDAAVITAPLVPHAELEELAILDERLVTVAPADTSARTWKQALTRHPFLRINRESGVGTLVDATLRAAAIQVNEAMELDSSEAILGLARVGLGAGVVPAGRIAGAGSLGLRAFPFGAPPVSRRVILVERHNNQRSDLAQLIYRELKRLTRPPKTAKASRNT